MPQAESERDLMRLRIGAAGKEQRVNLTDRLNERMNEDECCAVPEPFEGIARVDDGIADRKVNVRTLPLLSLKKRTSLAELFRLLSIKRHSYNNF